MLMMEILHLRVPVCGDGEFSREIFFIFSTLIQPTFIKHLLCVMHCWYWGTRNLSVLGREGGVIFQGANEFMFYLRFFSAVF